MNLFGNFERHDWCQNTFMNYVSEFWVEACALSSPYADFVSLFLYFTVSIRFWGLVTCVQLLCVSCIPIIINFVVYLLSIYFLNTCCQVRMIVPLVILLATCLGKDVFLEVIICLCCSAFMIMCVLIYTHVSYCECTDLCAALFASWGFVAKFTNYFLVVTWSSHGWFITLFNFMILLLHNVRYPQLNHWCLLLLSLEFFWDLIMVSGHKVHPLWPTANPCLLYTSPSPRDGLLSRMPSSA